MPNDTGSWPLKQCPHCTVWLRVKTDNDFKAHCQRCLWRKRVVYLSLLAFIFAIAAFAMALAAVSKGK